MSCMTLLQLPAELLCHILAFLDGPAAAARYDLVRVRRTCKALKELIDNSETLQYIIDLCYFRMVHVGVHETNVPSATHRRQLGQHEDAWRTFGYKRNGMYASIREDRIHFTRLPSVSDSGDVHSWSHLIDIDPVLAFAFCPEQDLLVIVTSAPDNDSHAVDIYLRSLTTNEVHPNAAQSVLKGFDTHHVMFPEVGKLQINGNYISLQCRGDYNHSCVQTWDWKYSKGYQFMVPLNYEEECTDCSFIAEDTFLVGSWKGLEIYYISDKSKPPQCAARLSLPALTDGWSFREVTMSINPSPSSVFLDLKKSPQQPSLDSQLITLHVVVEDEDVDIYDVSFSFVVRLDAILQIERHARRHDRGAGFYRFFPWAVWGPQITRCLFEESNQSLYGFRTVGFLNEGCSYRSSELRQLCIRDFNPHNICDYGADDETGRHGRLVRGSPPTAVYHPFTEPMGCALPYREIISEELFDADETIMDGSRILLPKWGRDGLEKLEVLIF